MMAQVFDVHCFKSGFLHIFQNQADMRQLTVREYVFFDEFTTAERSFTTIRIGAGDAVVHANTVIVEKVVNDFEVIDQMFQTDMFEHADTGDAVEFA